LTLPHGKQLGGVAGEGCKDGRTYYRESETPIFTYDEYLDWQMSNPRFGSAAYVAFWRNMAKGLKHNRIVFTHGDPHPRNIIVEQTSSLEGGTYKISGIVDWEESGFYPEYVESTKATRNHGSHSSDWFNMLPRCISPSQFLLHWHTMNHWAEMAG